MRNHDILILRGADADSLLVGRKLKLMDTVRMAYETHGRGASSLPHSTFLNFPDNQRDRIIALPTYLSDEWGIAGIKWVASFPGNLKLGMDRASALVVLNSSRTGRPETILEGSLINAKRNAASAALAAQLLHRGAKVNCTGLIGCGLISFEIVRFLLVGLPEIKHLVVYDLDVARAERFKRKCQRRFGAVKVEIANQRPDVACFDLWETFKNFVNIVLMLVGMLGAGETVEFIQFDVLSRNVHDDFWVGRFGLDAGAINPSLYGGRMNAFDSSHGFRAQAFNPMLDGALNFSSGVLRS